MRSRRRPKARTVRPNGPHRAPISGILDSSFKKMSTGGLSCVQGGTGRSPNVWLPGQNATLSSKDSFRGGHMETNGQSLEFAGGTVGEHRHICGFFNSIDEEHRVLRSFIKE